MENAVMQVTKGQIAAAMSAQTSLEITHNDVTFCEMNEPGIEMYMAKCGSHVVVACFNVSDGMIRVVSIKI